MPEHRFVLPQCLAPKNYDFKLRYTVTKKGDSKLCLTKSIEFVG